MMLKQNKTTYLREKKCEKIVPNHELGQGITIIIELVRTTPYLNLCFVSNHQSKNIVQVLVYLVLKINNFFFFFFLPW